MKDTPKVTGFIGEKNKPAPIPGRGSEKVIEQMAEGAIRPKPKFYFEEGDEVAGDRRPFLQF